MILLFSERRSKTEEEITKILTRSGVSHISDRHILRGDEKVTAISLFRKTDISLKSGVAVFCDDADRFIGQNIPDGITGICEDTNTVALKVFQENNVKVISCGMGPKNTVTFSSINENALLVTLQRSITDCNGEELLPCELKIKLKQKYNPFSVMAATTVLLLYGIIPECF